MNNIQITKAAIEYLADQYGDDEEQAEEHVITIISMCRISGGDNAALTARIAELEDYIDQHNAKVIAELDNAARIAELEAALDSALRKLHANTCPTWKNGVSLGITYETCPHCADKRALLKGAS